MEALTTVGPGGNQEIGGNFLNKCVISKLLQLSHFTDDACFPSGAATTRKNWAQTILTTRQLVMGGNNTFKTVVTSVTMTH